MDDGTRQRKRMCLMKNTERKDLGDHLSVYPKNMFDEANTHVIDINVSNINVSGW